MDQSVKDAYNRAESAKFLHVNNIISRKEYEYWYSQYEKVQNLKADEIAEKWGKKPQYVNIFAFNRASITQYLTVEIAIKQLYDIETPCSPRSMIAQAQFIANKRGQEISEDTKKLIEEVKKAAEAKAAVKHSEQISLF